MIPSHAIRHLRKIRISTSRLITDAFAGNYKSAFKGKGIEFREVREYQAGDDIRFIDWNVTARTGHPYVKKFLEERELTVMFLLDASASFHFGTCNQPKTQLAAELCSLLSFTAVKNNDKIGLILFSDRIEKFIPPGKGISHALQIVRDALYFSPEGQGTNIPLALEYLNKVLKRNTVAFILSDFYSPGLSKALSVAGRRHDIIAVTITDPAEIAMPDIGICRFSDAETGEDFLIDTSDQSLRKKYNKNALERIEERQKLFRTIQVDHIHITNDTPYIQTLFSFFKMRERRQSR